MKFFSNLRTKLFRNNLAPVLVVIVFGIIGVYYLVASHASGPVNCSSYSSGSGTAVLCANISSKNQVSARVDYKGSNYKNTLVSATLSLYGCSKAATTCSTIVSTSSKIHKPNFLIPQNQYLLTGTVNYSSSNVYMACVTLSNKAGWNLPNSCTSLVSFGAGYGDTIAVYTGASTQTTATNTNSSSSSSTTTTTTTNAPTCGGETPPAKSNGSAWVCSFNDEFEGSSLNTNKWVPQLTATSNFTEGADPYKACFKDDSGNISVGGGSLSLTLRKENQAFTCAPNSSKSFTTSYSSGEVTTYRTFSQQYGRFEIRAKLPTTKAKGLQETLWLWPNNATKYGAWPASGEIDLAEFYSLYYNYNVPYIHYNYDISTYNKSTNTNIVTLLSPSYNSNYYNCAINYGEFNTYTAVWRSGYIELDVNGKPCVVDNYLSTAGSPPAPFDQAFFLALTQGIGTKIGSQDNAFDPSVTPVPATTQIDYVRVWK